MYAPFSTCDDRLDSLLQACAIRSAHTNAPTSPVPSKVPLDGLNVTDVLTLKGSLCSTSERPITVARRAGGREARQSGENDKGRAAKNERLTGSAAAANATAGEEGRHFTRHGVFAALAQRTMP